VRSDAYEDFVVKPTTFSEAAQATVLALDLGTTTCWALRMADGTITSGTVGFKPGRFEGGGMWVWTPLTSTAAS
jgi:hypothetical protein